MFGKQYLADYLDHDYLTKGTQPSYNAEFGATDDAKSEAQGSNDAKSSGTQ
ncbi:hypothetical protein D3C84_1277170 [compost metagenome]